MKYPDYIPCKMHTDNNENHQYSLHVPHDLPKGCLLRIGPNDATWCQNEGFLDGKEFKRCIIIPPVDEDK